MSPVPFIINICILRLDEHVSISSFGLSLRHTRGRRRLLALRTAEIFMTHVHIWNLLVRVEATSQGLAFISVGALPSHYMYVHVCRAT